MPGAVGLALALSLIGIVLWIGAIFLAPALESRGSSRAASFIYALFSPTCHQIPGRCFAFHGHPLAVCARCLGVYVGFLGGLLAYPFVRGFSRTRMPAVRSFLLASLPIGLDAMGGILGFWSSPIGVRFATGFVWGTILPLYSITGLADLIAGRKNRTRESGGLAPGPKQNVENPPPEGVE